MSEVTGGAPSRSQTRCQRSAAALTSSSRARLSILILERSSASRTAVQAVTAAAVGSGGLCGDATTRLICGQYSIGILCRRLGQTPTTNTPFGHQTNEGKAKALA